MVLSLGGSCLREILVLGWGQNDSHNYVEIIANYNMTDSNSSPECVEKLNIVQMNPSEGRSASKNVR